MAKVKLQVLFSGGERLEMSDKTFKESVDYLLEGISKRNLIPLKFTLSTGKVLHFDLQHFRSFSDNAITMAELLELTQCDELYRNTVEVKAGNEHIDPGALWKQRGRELILVDEERHVVYLLNNEAFEIAR